MSNPAQELIQGVFGLTSAILGVALITLLINRSGDTVKILETGGSTFNSILKTLTLSGGSYG